jgi:arylsulfatase A-like enzyme
MRLRLLPALLGLLAAPTASAAAGAAEPASARQRPDLILLSVDTLRRDHLSCYGHERLTTPNVDALASRGVLFTDCQAVVPLTGPSHASMLTGLHPQTHGAFRNGVRLPAGPVTLGELLGPLGYRTHAVVAGWTLAAPQCGLDRGFQTYDDDGMDERVGVVTRMRRADAVTDAALAWVDEELVPAGDERPPTLLLVHYFDPHEPYTAPLDEAPPPNPAADGGPALVKYHRHLEDYDREIAFTDLHLGRLLDGLEERGLLDEAVVVFTADHGQSFGEHGEGGPEGKHGRRVYQSTIAAPLVVAAPGLVPGGRRSELPVSHLDLFPTLAALAGVPWRTLPAGLQGHDLSGVLVDPEAEPPWGGARRLRHAVAYRGAVGNKWNLFRAFMNRDVDDALPLHYGLRDGAHAVLVNPRKPHRFEVFDLREDPGELSPLEGEERDRFRGHVTRLAEWYERTAGDLDTSPLTAEQVEGLRSLGYVGN